MGFGVNHSKAISHPVTRCNRAWAENVLSFPRLFKHLKIFSHTGGYLPPDSPDNVERDVCLSSPPYGLYWFLVSSILNNFLHNVELSLFACVVGDCYLFCVSSGCCFSFGCFHGLVRLSLSLFIFPFLLSYLVCLPRLRVIFCFPLCVPVSLLWLTVVALFHILLFVVLLGSILPRLFHLTHIVDLFPVWCSVESWITYTHTHIQHYSSV